MSDVIGERVAVLYTQDASDPNVAKAASSFIFKISQVGLAVRGFPQNPGASTESVEQYVEGLPADVVIFGDTAGVDTTKVREATAEEAQEHVIAVGQEQDFLAALIARRQERLVATEVGEEETASVALDPNSPTYHDDVMRTGFAVVQDGKTRLPMLVASEVAEAVFDQVSADYMRRVRQLVAETSIIDELLTDEQRAIATQQIQEMETAWQQQ